MKVFLLATLIVLQLCCKDAVTKPEFAKENFHVVVPRPILYNETKTAIDSTRKSIRKTYQLAGDSVKTVILSDIKAFLLKAISQDLYGYWKGTPWDFNGTTTVPNQGSIACGYFVTGLLQDAGYKLKRIKLSTCASMTMMKELTSSKDISNLSSLSYEEFESWVKNYGKGLFIVGLDLHTGFVINDGSETWFMHSNYIYNIGVMKEKLNESAALRASKTRYITCLTDNEKFLKNWLLN